MSPFTHTHADIARIEYLHVASGGLVPRNLIVIANIPLNKSSPGYSAAKVDSLTRSAVDYARRAGIAEITFESVN